MRTHLSRHFGVWATAAAFVFVGMVVAGYL
jgi:hypothetical protein